MAKFFISGPVFKEVKEIILTACNNPWVIVIGRKKQAAKFNESQAKSVLNFSKYFTKLFSNTTSSNFATKNTY